MIEMRTYVQTQTKLGALNPYMLLSLSCQLKQPLHPKEVDPALPEEPVISSREETLMATSEGS